MKYIILKTSALNSFIASTIIKSNVAIRESGLSNVIYQSDFSKKKYLEKKSENQKKKASSSLQKLKVLMTSCTGLLCWIF